MGRTTEEIVLRITGDNASAVQALRGLKDALAGGHAPAQALGRVLDTSVNKPLGLLPSIARTAIGTFAGFVGAQGILQGVGSALDFVKSSAIGMNATLEKTELQFTTLMGDADKAKAHVKDLFEIAKETPFETGPIIEASRMLQTFGGEALNTRDRIVLLGDSAAATGAPIDQLGFWTGRLYAQLKGGQPFGEAAMRLQELAVMTPEARREMEALQKQGKSGEEVFRVFEKSLGKFTGAMKTQAKTWEGGVSTLKDTLNLLAADAFKPVFDSLKEGLLEVNEWLGSEEVQEGARVFAEKAGEAIKTVVSVAKDDVIPAVTKMAEVILDTGQEIYVKWKSLPEPVKDTAVAVAELTAAVWLLNTALTALAGSSAAKGIATLAGHVGTLIAYLRLGGLGGGGYVLSQWAKNAGLGALGGTLTGLASSPGAILGGALVGGRVASGSWTGLASDIGSMLPHGGVHYPGFAARNMASWAEAPERPKLPASPLATSESLVPTSPYAKGMVSGGSLAGAEKVLSKEEQKKVDQLKEALSDLKHRYDKIAEATQLRILDLKKQGVSEGDIALIVGVHEAAVKHLIDTDEERRKKAKEFYALEREHREWGEEGVEDVRKQALERAEATHEGLVTALEAHQEYHDKVADLGKTELQRQLDAIETERRAAIAALGQRTEQNKLWYDEAVKDIDAYYDHELAKASGTAETIVERMRDAGVATREDLEDTAAAARRDYEQMRSAGVFTAEQIEEAWLRWYEADRHARGESSMGWLDALSTLAGSFQQLAQIAGDSLENVVRSVGTVVSSLDMAQKAHDQFKQGWAALSEGFSLKNLTSAISGVVGMISAGVTMAKALWDALARPSWKSAQSDINNAFGVNVSEQFAQQLTDEAKKYGLNRTQAGILHMPELIQQAGGLNAQNIGSFQAKAVELFGLIKRGGEVGQKATAALDETMQLFAKHVAEAGGIADARFIAMVERAQAEGLKLAGVTEFVEGQIAKLASSAAGITKGFVNGIENDLAKFLKGLPKDVLDNQDKLDSATKKKVTELRGHYQTEFDRVNRLVFKSFNAMIAEGKSLPEAIEAVGPAIDDLIANATKFGFAGSEAFDKLKRWRELAAANKPLLDSLGSTADMMAALINLGQMDEDTFRDLQAQGVSAVEQLKAAGFSETEALTQAKPLLETIIKAHKDKGLAIDEATQKLIDQAEAEGILSEEQASTQDVLKEGLGQIIELLGGELPEAWKKAGRAVDDFGRDGGQVLGDMKGDVGDVGEAIDRLKPPDWKKWKPPQDIFDLPDIEYPDGAPRPEGAETEPFPSFDDRPLERVIKPGLALLHPGDVVGVPKGPAFAPAGAASAKAGDLTLNVFLMQMMDGEGVDRVMEKHGVRSLARALSVNGSHQNVSLANQLRALLPELQALTTGA
jgi:hypothetical protein